jgi:hypothetical protein
MTSHITYNASMARVDDLLRQAGEARLANEARRASEAQPAPKAFRGRALLRLRRLTLGVQP